MAHGERITRRTVLRGAGVAVALPWLNAMSPALARAQEEGESGKPPVRLAYFYVPNGVHMPAWRPTEPVAEGAEAPTGRREHSLDELPPTMRSLEPVKDRVMVISGLAADHCNGNSAAHEPAGGGFLVGQRCKHSEEPEVGGISIDQLVARQVGLQTPVDSLALGIDPGHRGDHGYSGTYMSHISWRSKTTPAALELNPRQVYERLFANRTPRRPDWSQSRGVARLDSNSIEGSILDLVREDAASMQRQLGYEDRRKLAEYLEGLHSIERRIALADQDRHSHHQDAFAGERSLEDDDPELAPLIIPEGKGIPSLYADHVNLMLDILTLAFQTDTTRVASFMFSYEKSGRSYREIEAPGSHHSTSHHQGKAENHTELTRINTHHMDLFARMLQRMSEIPEGDGSLLDNVMILYGSGISDGNSHNHDDLPILVAGGAGGTMRGGRHLLCGDKTPLCNLYLEMLQRVGMPHESFGDSTGLLGDLG